MTITTPGASSEVQQDPGTVSVTIDGTTVSVPKGTLVIRAAEQVGIEIPRFCDHPLLKPAGACRQCLVEVEGQRKPVASCTLEVADGMVVATQQTSPVADQVRAPSRRPPRKRGSVEPACDRQCGSSWMSCRPRLPSPHVSNRCWWPRERSATREISFGDS